VRRVLKFWPALLGLALLPLNTDGLIPFLRGFFGGSVLVTVVGVSVLANSKVLLSFWGFGKTPEIQTLPEAASGVLAKLHKLVRDWTVPAIALLTLVPVSGLRAFCTAWCSATQSRPGLATLLLVNPVHVWTLVLGWDWVLSLLT
jgi:hypothetical protein